MSQVPVLVELTGPGPLPVSAGFAPFASLNSSLQLDPAFEPVEMVATRTPGFRMNAPPQSTVVRAFANPAAVDELRAHPNVVGVYSDPPIAPFCNCKGNAPVTAGSATHLILASNCDSEDCTPTVPTGSAADVATKLGVKAIWDRGYSGQGVVVGILDGGVDRSRYPVIGGWSPKGAPPPGVASHWDGHGNMCAFDALIAAPAAKIYDLGIGKSNGAMASFLSGVLQAVEWAILRYENDGTPQVISNSWGLYQQSWDPFPPGDPGNYTHNPLHPLNRKLLEAIDAGMLVTFAAGNCGSSCPSMQCGPDVGEGRSIRGAAGLERVLCVGAANLRHERIGYSSEGPAPAALDPSQTKPDLCAYSHFTGHFNSDNGTSAACPVLAGVLALFRSALPTLRQDQARLALNSTAINLCAPGYDRQTGHGIVNPTAAFGQLTGVTPTLVHRTP